MGRTLPNSPAAVPLESTEAWPPLLDRFGRRHNYLRISLTEHCNLACVYCISAEGVAWKRREESLSDDEIERLAAIFVRCGVDKIRLTGGEPTVRRGLTSLIARLRTLSGLKTLLMSTGSRPCWLRTSTG